MTEVPGSSPSFSLFLQLQLQVLAAAGAQVRKTVGSGRSLDSRAGVPDPCGPFASLGLPPLGPGSSAWQRGEPEHSVPKWDQQETGRHQADPQREGSLNLFVSCVTSDSRGCET